MFQLHPCCYRVKPWELLLQPVFCFVYVVRNASGNSIPAAEQASLQADPLKLPELMTPLFCAESKI